MKTITIKTREGIEVYKTDTKEFLGIFLNTSFGPYGKSTGVFKECKTRAPLTELGITMIDAHYVKEWE